MTSLISEKVHLWDVVFVFPNELKIQLPVT